MTRLKELRKEKKLTREELAEETGIPCRTLQRWENGETQIKPDKAENLAYFFGVGVGYLLGYDDNDIKNETDIKVSVIDEVLKKLHTISDTVLVESGEAPSMWAIGFGTAIVAVESLKKEIREQKSYE